MSRKSFFVVNTRGELLLSCVSVGREIQVSHQKLANVTFDDFFELTVYLFVLVFFFSNTRRDVTPLKVRPALVLLIVWLAQVYIYIYID